MILKAMLEGEPRMILAHRMEVIMGHDDMEWEAHCFISSKTTLDSGYHIHVDTQPMLDKHKRVFEVTTPGIPLDRGFEHIIEMEEGAKPIIMTPYHHPRNYKEDIERIITKLLDMGHVRLSSNPFTSSVVLVKKKDDTLHMCIDYHALNKGTIKNKYPIPCIDELLDELHGIVYFSKINLRLGYHQIQVCEEDVHKTTFYCHYGH